MAVPDYQTLMLPLLRQAANKGGETNIVSLIDEIARELTLTTEDVEARIPSGGETLIQNRLHWAKGYMQRAGLVESTRHGYFRVTERGASLLSERLARIDNTVLSRFPNLLIGRNVAQVQHRVNHPWID